VVRWQFPAGTVIGDFEIMGDPPMPAEHLGAIPALEANDVILLVSASMPKVAALRCAGFSPSRSASMAGAGPAVFDFCFTEIA